MSRLPTFVEDEKYKAGGRGTDSHTFSAASRPQPVSRMYAEWELRSTLWRKPETVSLDTVKMGILNERTMLATLISRLPVSSLHMS